MILLTGCSGCPSPGRVGCPHAHCTMGSRRAGALRKCADHRMSPAILSVLLHISGQCLAPASSAPLHPPATTITKPQVPYGKHVRQKPHSSDTCFMALELVAAVLLVSC